MLRTGPQGGWGAGATSAPPNPFNPAPPPPGNPFAKPPSNPFFQNNETTQTPIKNPFAAPTVKANPFSAVATSSLKRSVSPSPTQTAKRAADTRNPFDPVNRGSSTGGLQSGLNTNHQRNVATFVQPAWPNGSDASTALELGAANSKRRKGGLGALSNGQNGASLPAPKGLAGKHGLASGFGANDQNATPRGVSNSIPNKHSGRSDELASKIQQQLSKDRIKPPPWPANPGSHAQRQEMENFRESYKVYREKARKSLIRAGLIDDPDQRRTLQQALDFRGISEEMCPEWEKITRIIEYDVRQPEKATDSSGDLVAIPSLMVKRLARSAAGQDAPLPMDVRSFATLRKTLDYLIDDLIPDDSFLPSKHNFLWDRTRAIRIDLSVQKYNLTLDERTDLVYCLETIARFHVTALHLLSQNGFAAEDFSEQQEIEQLGKTLISLKEMYDDCVEQGIECANEAEFRGYYIVFNARNPSIKETVEGWGTRLWNSSGIRTALCLVESLQNTWTLQGPLNPYAPTEVAWGAAAIFFSIVSSSEISYTMACFAEIHFNDVRKSILQILRRSYTRPRDGPKDITPTFLKERLRLDTEDEAVDFAQKHGIVFGHDGTHQYAILNTRQSIGDPRIRHAFSRSIVERKRSGHSLPDVIHETVYQEDKDEAKTASQDASLFVPDIENTTFDTSGGLAHDSETDGAGSVISSSLSATINGQSSGIGVASWSQPQVASIFSSSETSQPSAQTSKATASTAPFVFGSAPTHNPSLQATSSIFDRPLGSSLGTVPDTVSNNKTKSQPNANMSTSVRNNEDNARSNTFISPSSTTSQGTFSFPKNQTNLGKPDSAGQSTSTSPFTTSPRSIFSANMNAEGNAPNIVASTPTTISPPGAVESSSTGIHTQISNIPRGQTLFEATASPVILNNNAVSASGPNPSASPPKLNPSFPPSEKGTGALNQSESSPRLLSTLSRPGDKSTTNQKTPSVAVPTTIIPEMDPMADFTRWFVLADKGLMEDKLQAFAVEHILKSTWKDFEATEKERIRQEEDERSWAEALEYRQYSLKITFFYRWLNITRKRRVIKRIQLEKEKARRWNLPQNIKEREIAEGVKRRRAIQEAKELVGKRTKEHAREAGRMRESTQSEHSIEEALLATGVFSGMQDARAAARHAARDDDVEHEGGMSPSENLRLRSENQRRRTRGLPPLKQFPEAKAYREGSKTAMLRAISSGAGRDTLSMSTGSLRNSTFSSSYRSSLGFNHSRVGKSRPSITDPYWRMKANGLVQMPNGEYLHETLALPMLREGKRFPGLGDYGLPPEESFTPSQSPPAGLLVADSVSPTPARFPGGNRASRSPSILDGAAQKRKRDEAEDEDLAAYRKEVPVSRKRAKSNDRATPATPSADQDFLDGIADLLSKVNAATKTSS